MNNLFLPPDEAALRILESLPEIVEKTFPVPLRFRAALPRDVSELSGLLTSQRELRGSSYLGKPSLLSAYLRYFMPWNIYRLCRLLSGLPIALKANDT
ncbi:MAG: rRNA methyltransferase, partial [Treponema sp.]|nr:rRNA methyltransferase [Treponema sp.]